MNRATAIINLLRQGVSPRETAEATGCSLPNVYATARRYGVTMSGQPSVLADRKAEVKKLLADGIGYREMARLLGVTRNTIRSYCRNNGLELTDDVLNSSEHRYHKKNDCVVEREIEGYDLEYLGGYVNNATPMKVRCKKCGAEFERSLICIRKAKECPTCKAQRIDRERKATEETKRKRQAEREAKRLKKKHDAERKRIERLHPCAVCGRQTDRPKYCSDVCKRKAENKNRELKRRNRIKDAMVDKDITVQGLYNRDAGQCYICGLMCRWDDYIQKDGTIICGDWYPSIDHVKPLAKGGNHSWSNVKLAHRRCNIVKSDLIYSPDTPASA